MLVLSTVLATSTFAQPIDQKSFSTEDSEVEEAPPAKKKGRATVKPLRIDFGENQFISALLWSQFWTRIQQHNPGTTINGEPTDVSANVGIRRARVLLWGRPNKRMLIMTHVGINNQTFNNQRKPQVFVHDAWVEGTLVENSLDIGIGLHYWNGVSRAANQSTLGFMAIDGPIFPWTVIELTDQFARQMGIYAKGKIAKLDYRVAVNQPFVPGVAPVAPDEPGVGATQYRDTNNYWAVQGYAKLELADPESNTLPYLNGTYLGTKKVVNIGVGAQWNPQATGRIRLGEDGETVEETFDQTAVGVDLFIDTPVGRGAWNTYALYQFNNYGPDYVRNVGIMNVGDVGSGTSFNGRGTAYPLQGTGHSGYIEAGYLLPGSVEGTRLQPYVASQASFFEGLGAPMVLAEAGANWYLAGQNAKITAHWRNRPVFAADGQSVESRANEGIVQAAFRY